MGRTNPPITGSSQAKCSVTRRVAIESGVSDPWHRWTGPAGRIVGLDTFGKSAPAKDLFQYFGFTPEHVAKVALELLGA